MSAERPEIMRALNDLLSPELVKDYCPNGLQLEGTQVIKKVVTGVTASQALIDCAIESQADALLVHHGYFWKGESPQIVGMKKRRIQALLQLDINLIAYHLPLDVHPKVGNNAMLGKIMGMDDAVPMAGISPNGIVYEGRFEQPTSSEKFVNTLEQALKRNVFAEVHSDTINTIAWCTGGGQGYIEAAADAGVDAFLTGEMSEQTIHVAREMGINFYCAGHHATERYGVKALGEWLKTRFPIEVEFIDIDNPA